MGIIIVFSLFCSFLYLIVNGRNFQSGEIFHNVSSAVYIYTHNDSLREVIVYRQFADGNLLLNDFDINIMHQI